MATTRAEEAAAGKGMAAYRATSLFQPHHTREAIRDAHEGKIAPLLGLYLALSSVPTARFVAPLGFDSVWIDWEHSSCGVETMTTMVHEIQFMSEGRTIPWVRVPGHDHAAIGFALDAGASIVIPQVDTVAEARHAVSSAKYGAKNRGTRSAPPFRLIPRITNLPSDPELSLHENLNRQAAIMIQIETLEAINNLDAILTEVPDIDAVWLGTLDIRVSMGLPGGGFGGTEPEFLQAVARFESILKKHDKPRGGAVIGTPEAMRALGKENSISFVAMDAVALIGTTQILAESRNMFPAQRKMLDAETKAEVNGDGVKKALTNGHANGVVAKVQTNGHANGHANGKVQANWLTNGVNGKVDE